MIVDKCLWMWDCSLRVYIQRSVNGQCERALYVEEKVSLARWCLGCLSAVRSGTEIVHGSSLVLFFAPTRQGPDFINLINSKCWNVLLLIIYLLSTLSLGIGVQPSCVNLLFLYWACSYSRVVTVNFLLLCVQYTDDISQPHMMSSSANSRLTYGQRGTSRRRSLLIITLFMIF